MSSSKRPWYKWYPRDFNQDEKVKGLGWDAELIYRRLLDVMWQSNDCQLPNDIDYLHKAVAIAIPKKRFATAWLQIQRENFELFIEKDGWITSERLKSEMEAVNKLSKIRRKLGQKGGVAKAVAIAKQKLYQKGSDTDTDTDIKEKEYKEKEINNYTKAFTAFYVQYPIKKSKGQAFKTWKKLKRENQLPDLKILLNAIEQQKKEKEIKIQTNQFCPEWKYPSTWLNQKCWEDETEINTPPDPPQESLEELCS